MDIGEAVGQLRQGKKVARGGWNGRGTYLFFVPREYSDAANPLAPSMLEHVVMRTADNWFVPWNCSQVDLLASDWTIVT